MASSTPTPTLPNVGGTAMSWFTSWIAILLVIVLLAQTKWGRPIVYYAIWLAVALLIFGHASELASIISPGGQNNNA